MSEPGWETPSRAKIEAHIERQLWGGGMDRRRFLGRTAGAVAMTSGLSAFLSACGIAGTAEQNVDQLAKIAATVNHPKVEIGAWVLANWPLYIDKSVLRE